MTDKVKVKVIKKDEIGKAVDNAAPVKLRSKREAAREIVSNVSMWVNDFQARRRDDTKVAVEKLFGSTPQPSES